MKRKWSLLLVVVVLCGMALAASLPSKGDWDWWPTLQTWLLVDHAADGTHSFSSLVISNGGTVGQSAGPLLTFDDTNNELELTGGDMIIENGLGLVVGHTGQVATTATHEVQVLGTQDDVDSVVFIGLWNATDNTQPRLKFLKSGNGTIGSSTIVADDELLGEVIFQADDGTDYASSVAYVRAAIDGTPGTNDVPGRLMFGTTADGAASPTERARITSTGNLLVGTTLNPTGTAGIVFADGTILSSMGTNTAGLYANDASGTVEMYAIDEAGNSSILTDAVESEDYDPNLGAYLPTGKGKSNPYVGIDQYIDIFKLARAVEALTGETFIRITQMEPNDMRDWDADQQSKFDRVTAQQASAQGRIVAMNARIASPDPNDDVGQLILERDGIVIPDDYTKSREPDWIKAVRAQK